MSDDWESTPSSDGWESAPPSVWDRVKRGAMVALGASPPGIAIKASSALGNAIEHGAYKAGGAVTDALSPALPPEAAAAGGYLTNLGLQGAATLAGGNLGAKAIPAMESFGKTLMVKALGPTPSQMKSGKGMAAAETMLETGTNPSTGGVEKIRGMINNLNEEIKGLVENANVQIKVGDIGRELASKFNKASVQNLPEKDLAALRTAWEQFKNNPLIKDKLEIAGEVAQRLKQGTYKALGEKPYEKMLNPSSVEAEMALARGERKALAEAIPGLEQANSQESKLLNALNLAERRALLDIAKNPGGLGWVAHNPAAFGAYVASHSTPFKALLARYFYHHADPAMAGYATAAGLGAYSGSAPPNQQTAQ